MGLLGSSVFNNVPSPLSRDFDPFREFDCTATPIPPRNVVARPSLPFANWPRAFVTPVPTLDQAFVRGSATVRSPIDDPFASLKMGPL